jgi:hypothetical protein
MPLENLSHRYVLNISNYPIEWLPFVHLYDADIPLFPLQYFHVVSSSLPRGQLPSPEDRAFGYIERVHFTNSGLEVVIICNKDLADPINALFLQQADTEIRERLGISHPVTPADVAAPFQPQNSSANAVMMQIWQRVVAGVLGNQLPFGRFFDHVFGLGRCVASFYSPAGRKSEWIQTHYYASQFGEKIPTAANLPKMDYYLLPTFQEMVDPNNPLSLFPRFKALIDAANDFHQTFCSVRRISGQLSFSKFTNPYPGSLSTESLLNCINQLSPNSIEPLTQCFNAFDKGPIRTVMFLQMLNDIVAHRLVPWQLTSNQFGSIYDNLGGFYQTPKVIALYAQQCFGNTSALPIDTWVEAFMKWPLAIYPTYGNRVQGVLANVSNLGKVERLIWISAQARKIHSSLCNDALWCIKYDSRGRPRGANPFACNACLASIRAACPAYSNIANETIAFNAPRGRNRFVIWTDQRNNITQNQRFVLCEGVGMYGEIQDDFTSVDVPSAFAAFPLPGHQGQPMTVNQFVNSY